MKKVFIDGKAGTAGLRIYDRLQNRGDITLLQLSEQQRKDPAARKEMLNTCDIAFLCLPDPAAVEAVGMIENAAVTVIDTSTAHRTNPDWVYGFAELNPGQAQKITAAKRIAIPGCHAGGFVALVAPLVQAGILPKDALLSCHSLTGYSGGGKKMIEQYEQSKTPLLFCPRQYGLTQTHKHLKEMTCIPGLAESPIFCPIVDDYYSGMEVTVPVFAKQLCPGKTVKDICAAYAAAYTGPVVRYVCAGDEDGFLSAGAYSGRDDMGISVFGGEERILLTARFDNLGKGASGAAIQCMNLVLGADMCLGLELG